MNQQNAQTSFADTEKPETSRRLLLALISTSYIAVFANVQGFLALLPLVQDEFLITRAEAGCIPVSTF